MTRVKGGSSAARSPRRRRRTAEEARHAILEAAQKRLAECGPEEIRLQDIAADVGISHPAILHHFGSREGLMLALSRHALRALNDDLLRALGERRPAGQGGASAGGMEAWLDRVFEILQDRGHARLLAWAVLTGRIGEGGPEDRDHLLQELARAVHHRRTEIAAELGGGKAQPTLEESVFAVQLVAAALLGDALMGPLLRRSAGQPGTGQSDRFRSWLGERVAELLLPDASPPRRSGR